MLTFTAAIEEIKELVGKYSPDQPRVPAGSPDGGEFAGGEGGRAAAGGEKSSGGFGFTKDEEAAFKYYINDSIALNKYYREGQTGDHPKYNKTIENINNALGKSAINADATVYRGISKSDISRQLVGDHNAEKLIGQSLPAGGFQSTSTDPRVALEFATMGKTGRVMMQITLPSGTHVIDMSPYGNRSESEMLVGQGSYTITRVKRQSGQPLLIAATYRERR